MHGPIMSNGVPVYVGTSGWSARTLARETDWYPRTARKAADRCEYYATQLGTTEIDSTERFPPTPDMTRRFVATTPDGFPISLRAWALLCGRGAFPDSLWPDLQAEVPGEHRYKRRLYLHYLPTDAIAEVWSRVNAALAPLVESKHDGVQVFALPHWVRPDDNGRALLRSIATNAAALPAAVEFRSEHWLSADQLENTLSLLEDYGLAFSCIDQATTAPWSIPQPTVTTHDVAVLRVHGRAVPTFDRTSTERTVTEETDQPVDDSEAPIDEDDVRIDWATEWRWTYSDDELRSIARRVHDLASAASEVHVLFTNVYRADAVNAAQALQNQLANLPTPSALA